jgi:YesN/AraC family two-component response regulator
MQETGTTIKNYFYRTKLEIADELIRHYRLEAHEVAYQLGYKQPGRIGVNRNM